MKFGTEAYTMGLFSHGKFGAEWCRAWVPEPTKVQNLVRRSTLLKAKFHYASWFEAGSELDRGWFEPGSNLFEPASNQLA